MWKWSIYQWNIYRRFNVVYWNKMLTNRPQCAFCDQTINEAWYLNFITFQNKNNCLVYAGIKRVIIWITCEDVFRNRMVFMLRGNWNRALVPRCAWRKYILLYVLTIRVALCLQDGSLYIYGIRGMSFNKDCTKYLQGPGFQGPRYGFRGKG